MIALFLLMIFSVLRGGYLLSKFSNPGAHLPYSLSQIERDNLWGHLLYIGGFAGIVIIIITLRIR